jgi:glycosyltransferase involved in cell wall biosynthesis
MISESFSVKEITIPKHIAERVLTVGFEHKNHRGGIGGVIDTYTHYFDKFNFIATYPTHPNKWTLLFYFTRSYISLIYKILLDERLQVVHIHGAAKGSFYRKYIVFLTVKYLFRLKVIYHSHGSEFKLFYNSSRPFVRKMIHHFIENADSIICLSKQWEVFFLTNFKVKKLTVLGNVVEPTLVDLNRSTPSNRPLRLLFLGLIGNRKGIFDLLDIIQDHKQLLTGRLQLTIGGNGETKRLQDFIQLHQLDGLVNYVGWVSGAQKHFWLQQSDAYILPSYNEGLPLSILEAMSYNLPIISTPVGGTSEIVQEGINGFLINPGDKDALIDRLLRFIQQPELLPMMGLASGNIIRQYLPEVIFPKLQELYESLLNEKN